MSERPVATIAVSAFDRVGFIRLNRPEKLNAVNETMIDELCSTLKWPSGWRSVVIAGNATAFSSGADLGDSTARSRIAWAELLTELAELDIPTVAAIEGHCLGGGLLLALCCDYRVAGVSASIGCPEISRGFFPGSGMTQLLARMVGPPRAKEMIMLGRPISANRAETWGLVNVVVEDADTESTALQIAEQLADGPPLALKEVKKLIDKAALLSVPAAIEAERSASYVAHSVDAEEGTRAFFERRLPRFEGR